jgi:hypothetical protein
MAAINTLVKSRISGEKARKNGKPPNQAFAGRNMTSQMASGCLIEKIFVSFDSHPLRNINPYSAMEESLGKMLNHTDYSPGSNLRSDTLKNMADTNRQNHVDHILVAAVELSSEYGNKGKQAALLAEDMVFSGAVSVEGMADAVEAIQDLASKSDNPEYAGRMLAAICMRLRNEDPDYSDEVEMHARNLEFGNEGEKLAASTFATIIDRKPIDLVA